MKKIIISSLIVSSILLSGVQAFAATSPNVQDDQTTISGRTKREIPSKRVVSVNKRDKTGWKTTSTSYNTRTQKEPVYIDVNGMKVKTMKDFRYVTPIYHQERTVELITKYEYLAGGSPTGNYFTESSEMTETRDVEGSAQRYDG